MNCFCDHFPWKLMAENVLPLSYKNVAIRSGSCRDKRFQKNSRKDPGNTLRAFPGIPLESTAGIPQTLSFKAFEASRAFPDFSPPQYGSGCLFFRSGSREGLSSELIMEFPAVLRVFLSYIFGSSSSKSHVDFTFYYFPIPSTWHVILTCGIAG